MKKVTQAIALLLAACIVAESATAAGLQSLTIQPSFRTFDSTAVDLFTSEAVVQYLLNEQRPYGSHLRSEEVESVATAQQVKIASQGTHSSLWRRIEIAFGTVLAAYVGVAAWPHIVHFMAQPGPFLPKIAMLVGIGISGLSGVAAMVSMNSDSGAAPPESFDQQLGRAEKAPRRPIIGSNWKMNLTRPEDEKLVNDIITKLGKSAVASEVVVGVPFTAIPRIRTLIDNAGAKGRIQLAAQDVYWEEKGAYTGEISPVMLKAEGVEWVIIGHSERRQFFGETDGTVNKKSHAVLNEGLNAIICVGESLEEREAGKTFEVLERQIREGLKGLTAEQMKRVVIAYEPVWAIGTGITASKEDANLAQRHIRGVLLDMFGFQVAAETRIQYGGSMKPDNAYALMQQPNVDGGLIGGASLDAEQFVSIVDAPDRILRAATIKEFLSRLGRVPELPWTGEQRFMARARAYLSEAEAEKEIAALKLPPSQLRKDEIEIVSMLQKYVALQKLKEAGLETLLSAPADSLLLPAELLAAFAASKTIKTICDVLLLSDAEVEALAGMGPAEGPELHLGRFFVVALRKAIVELEVSQLAGVKKEDGAQKPKVVVADSIKIDQLGVSAVSDVIDLSKISDKVAKVAALLRSNPTKLIVRSATTVYENLVQQLLNLQDIVRAGHGTDNVKVLDVDKKRVHVSRTGGSEASVTAWTLRAVSRAKQGQAQFEQDAAPPSFYSIPEWKAAFEKKAPKDGTKRKELESVWEDMFRAIGSETIESLKEKRTGIIGFGDIGKPIAEMSKLLGMEVSVYSPSLKEKPNRAIEAGYAYASPDDMYANSHFVVLIPELHKTGPKKNVEMIGARETAILKTNDDVIAVINSARGALVNEEAMANLMQEKPGFLYIADDVPKHPYLVKHAIYTPHIGASTEEAENGVIAATKNKLAEIMTPVIWSSGAPKFILAELAGNSERDISQPAKTKFAGGTKVEGFIRTEKADIVVLDRTKMLDLVKKGLVHADSLVDLFQSGISVAVKSENAQNYDLTTADGIKAAVHAVLAKPEGKIGVSTGESGTYIKGELKKWGLPVEEFIKQGRIVEATPGKPVGELIAAGELDIGFQQTCELIHVEGVAYKELPDTIQKKTVFTAGILVASRSAYAARQVLDYMVSAVSSDAELHRKHGTEPVALDRSMSANKLGVATVPAQPVRQVTFKYKNKRISLTVHAKMTLREAIGILRQQAEANGERLYPVVGYNELNHKMPFDEPIPPDVNEVNLIVSAIAGGSIGGRAPEVPRSIKADIFEALERGNPEQAKSLLSGKQHTHPEPFSGIGIPLDPHRVHHDDVIIVYDQNGDQIKTVGTVEWQQGRGSEYTVAAGKHQETINLDDYKIYKMGTKSLLPAVPPAAAKAEVTGKVLIDRKAYVQDGVRGLYEALTQAGHEVYFVDPHDPTFDWNAWRGAVFLTNDDQIPEGSGTVDLRHFGISLMVVGQRRGDRTSGLPPLVSWSQIPETVNGHFKQARENERIEASIYRNPPAAPEKLIRRHGDEEEGEEDRVDVAPLDFLRTTLPAGLVAAGLIAEGWFGIPAGLSTILAGTILGGLVSHFVNEGGHKLEAFLAGRASKVSWFLGIPYQVRVQGGVTALNAAAGPLLGVVAARLIYDFGQMIHSPFAAVTGLVVLAIQVWALRPWGNSDGALIINQIEFAKAA